MKIEAVNEQLKINKQLILFCLRMSNWLKKRKPTTSNEAIGLYIKRGNALFSFKNSTKTF